MRDRGSYREASLIKSVVTQMKKVSIQNFLSSIFYLEENVRYKIL